MSVSNCAKMFVIPNQHLPITCTLLSCSNNLCQFYVAQYFIQLLTRSPPPCLFRLNSAIAEFIATGTFGWYQMVLMVRRLPGTTRYQPKILVGMNSAIAELMVTSTTWTHRIERARRDGTGRAENLFKVLTIRESHTHARTKTNSFPVGVV